MLRAIAIGEECTDAQASGAQLVHARQRQAADVDHARRTLDPALHEVDQVGAAREKAHVGPGGLNRIFQPVRAQVGEGLHALLLQASFPP
jgi:hypothetical protein